MAFMILSAQRTSRGYDYMYVYSMYLISKQDNVTIFEKQKGYSFDTKRKKKENHLINVGKIKIQIPIG